MLPIRDTIPSRNYPVVNNLLIAVNVFLFLVQLSQNAPMNQFVYIYGLVPARYTNPQLAAYFTFGQQLFSFISFMFLHGGFWHLLGNMWFLYIFGDNVEDSLGHGRYLAFYMICGIMSGLVHLLLNQQSNLPTIGASGAIAGVMGAYFILYPKSKILTLIPIFIFPWFVEIPAFIFLGIWFLMQLFNAAGGQGIAGIAWWAHIGGFVCGIICLRLLAVVPLSQLSQRIGNTTVKKKTPRLQVIRPVSQADDPHLYGKITITQFESYSGAKKMVNIPWGFYDRLFKITVPPGIQNGSVLRLNGMGKHLADGSRGDMLLTVIVQDV